MKRLLLIVLPLLLIVGCSQKPVDETTLIEKDGVMYLPDSDKPYSGEVFGSYPSGERLYIVSYKNGFLQDYKFFYKNGDRKKLVDETTLIEKDEVMYLPDSNKPYSGEVFGSYPSGERLYTVSYKNGILVEDYKFFFKNGDSKSSLQTHLFLEKDGKLFNKNGPHSGWTFDSWDPDIKIQGIKFYHCSKNILWMNGEFVKSRYTVTIHYDGKKKKEGTYPKTIVRKPILENNLIEKNGLKLDKYGIPYWGPVYGIYKSGEKHYDFNYEKGVVVGNYTFYHKDGGLKKPINFEEILIKRNNIFYTRDTNEPYTGPVFSLHYDGKKKKEGTFKDGKEDGLWTRWFDNGKKKKEGIYKDGKEDGSWTRWFDNGQKLDKGIYNYGKKDGLWTSWNEYGRKSSEITYKNGKLVDEWTFVYDYYENGQKKSEGTHKDGKKNGKWTTWYKDGTKIREGTYKDGKEDGLWTYWSRFDPNKGMKTKEGTYKDGKLDGLWTYWWNERIRGRMTSSRLEEGTYKDEKKDGLWTSWYPGGKKKSEVNYKDGIKEGKWTEWDDGGYKNDEGTYKDGKKDGKWTHFGYRVKSWETTYKDGKEDGLHTGWYDSGSRMLEGTYKDGKKVGLWTTWSDKGDLNNNPQLDGREKSKITYVDGKIVDKWEFVYKNFLSYPPRLEEGWKQGWGNNLKKVGLWTTWYRDRKKKSEVIYKDGGTFLSNSWDKNGIIMIKDGNGLLTDWYREGQKKSEVTYKDGKKDGKSTFYYKDGSIKEVKEY